MFFELFASYGTYAWPFALSHAVVLGFVFRSWWQLHREAQDLKAWQPEQSSDIGSEAGFRAAAILDQFVDEARRLGRQGFLVPVTDFSDRLDSTVNGLVAEFNDKTNLFLIVGIAGSLFGVFEFAFRASTLLGSTDPGGERIVKLGIVLSESLAKAFPVGFIGLVLMFLGQIAAAIREEALRAAVTAATVRALEQRSQAVRSQAQVIEQAATSIKDALQPINNLQSLLADSLEPVVRALGQRLDASLVLIKIQFEQLHTTTAGFSDSVGVLKSTTRALHESTNNLATLLRDAPEVLSRIDATQAQQAGIMHGFEANLKQGLRALEQLLPAIDSAATSVRGLPVAIEQATRTALDKAGHEALTAWNKAAQQVAAGHQTQLDKIATLTTEVARHVDNAQASFTTASQLLDANLKQSLQAVEQLRPAIESAATGVRELPVVIEQATRTALDKAGHEALTAWNKAAQQVAAGHQTQLDKIATLTREITQHVDSAQASFTVASHAQTAHFRELATQVSEEIKRVADATSTTVHNFETMRTEAQKTMAAEFRALHTEAAGSWEQMVGKFGGSLQQETLGYLERLKEVTQSLDSALKGVIEQAQSALQTHQVQLHDQLVKAIAEIHGNVTKTLCDADSFFVKHMPDAISTTVTFKDSLAGLLGGVAQSRVDLEGWQKSLNDARRAFEAAAERLHDRPGPPDDALYRSIPAQSAVSTYPSVATPHITRTQRPAAGYPTDAVSHPEPPHRPPQPARAPVAPQPAGRAPRRHEEHDEGVDAGQWAKVKRFFARPLWSGRGSEADGSRWAKVKSFLTRPLWGTGDGETGDEG